VSDLGNFAPPSLALDALDLGQDRITHGVESLRNQRRADDAVGIAGAERDRSAAPTLRRRPWKQIPHQINDVLEVVAKTNAFGSVTADRLAVRLGEAHRPADAGSTMQIFRQRRRHDSFFDIGFDQDMGFGLGFWADHRPDVQRRMRPSRLSEIFDTAGDTAFALDQQNIARSKRLA
jgi:hypothetical protein